MQTEMNILEVVILLLSLVNAQKDLSTIGTASQSSDYNWTARHVILTADLAISGTTKDTFAGEACSVTLFNPTQYVAWWMSVAILTCKSIVKLGYRGERLIEPSSSWFPPKFPSG